MSRSFPAKIHLTQFQPCNILSDMSTTKNFQMKAWDILRENSLQILMYVIGVVVTGLISWWLAVLYVV